MIEAKFSEPTLNQIAPETAQKILAKVRFEDRFMTGYLRSHMGVKRITLYSFKEILQFFDYQIPLINFQNLEKWVREIMGDKELADKIAEIRRANLIYRLTLMEVKGLMSHRLNQCSQTDDHEINLLKNL